MNRQFKTEFHNGGDKNIFVMNTYVANGNLYRNMDNEARLHAADEIDDYISKLQDFKLDILNNITY